MSGYYCGEEPLQVAKRWNKKENRCVKIRKTAVIIEYKRFMAGIDLMDMLSSLYNTLSSQACSTCTLGFTPLQWQL